MNLVLCKKQRRRFRFLPVKLCTIKVNIFLYCEFICKFSFSSMYFPLMFSTVGVWMF